MDNLGFNPYLAFGWSVLAGFIMSMGAGGGGILAGIGHISILGIGDANMIKVVNQILEFVSRIFSVPLYHRQKRLVWPLAMSYAAGAPAGAVAGSWLSKNHLSDMNVYRPVFGLLVAAVAARMLYEAWWKPRLGNPRETGESPGRMRGERTGEREAAEGSWRESAAPAVSWVTWRRVRVVFRGREFPFSTVLTAAGGFAISFMGAMIGVGGGFLVTPFMVTVLLIPMYLVVGTALLALMIPLAASVLAYVAMQVQVNWILVAVEVPGIVVGSILGPALNRYMNERLLKLYVAGVLFAIGMYYLV